jgi:hypothetical protein
MVLSSAERQRRWRARRQAKIDGIDEDWALFQKAAGVFLRRLAKYGHSSPANVGRASFVSLAGTFERLITLWPRLPFEVKKHLATEKNYTRWSSLLQPSLLLAALLTCGLASPAVAAPAMITSVNPMTADELLSMYRSDAVKRTVAAYWVNGFISGVMASSVHAEQDGKPIICANNVTIGQEFVVENMVRMLKDRPDLKTTTWPLVAFTALREAFPCK